MGLRRQYGRWAMWRSLLLVIYLPLSALYLGAPSLPEIPEDPLFSKPGFPVTVSLGYLGGITQRNNFAGGGNYGVVTANIVERVETYGFLGAQKGKYKPLERKTKFGTSWGVGGRVLLIDWNETVFGVSAVYQRSFLPFGDGTKLRMDAWQVGGAVGHRLGFFYPYLGLGYAVTDYNYQKAKKSDPNKFLLVLGTAVSPDKIFDVSLEASIFAQRALFLSANIRF